MLRTVFCCASIVILAQPARADEQTPPAETVVRLSVMPAAAPRPALRYLLLPELNEMNPGNPIQNYLKCFMEQQKFFFDKDAFMRREHLLAMPLKELPTAELQDYGEYALRQADWAARLDNPDWQVLLRLKIDGVSLLIPDVQQLRALATALKVRFRGEVALGRFDRAVRTAKTLFAMSRHLGEHPTIIGTLVGISIAYAAIGPLEEMLEQPGCPNLYWALANLPVPLVRSDKGVDGERALLLVEFRDLHDNAPMSPEQIGTFIAHMDKLLGEPGKPTSVRAWLEARTKDESKVSAACERLIQYGLRKELLVRFPADQVLLLDEKRKYEERRDDNMKYLNLPVWQIQALPGWTNPPKEPALFADALATPLHGVRLAQGRLEQRIALLRHVEALRLYAAEHNGTFPAKLSEVSVPLPDDPFTGRPFRYDFSGGTAHIRGTPPKEKENEAAFNVRFEVTIQK
jgi:hypothetical protein